MIKIFTEEILAFIREIAPGNYAREIAEMVNEKFGTNLTRGQIKNCLSREKIHNGMFGAPKRRPWLKLTTPEMDEFILAIYKMTPNKVLAQKVNDKFGTNFTAEQMDSYKSRNKLDSGLTGRFEKGHISANKGQKMSPELYEKCKATMFKKGHIPQNHKPVGSERINVEGYVEIKVAEPKKWMLKHRYIWEQANGPIPKDKIVIFKNGNKQDIRIENLMMISRTQSSIMSHFNLWSEIPELTELGANTADLIAKTEKKKKEMRKRYGRKRSKVL